jgi:hypothetical protein
VQTLFPQPPPPQGPQSWLQVAHDSGGAHVPSPQLMFGGLPTGSIIDGGSPFGSAGSAGSVRSSPCSVPSMLTVLEHPASAAVAIMAIHA